MRKKETKLKLNLQNMADSSHHFTEVLMYLSCTMADNTHSFRCTILYNPVVDAVVLYLAVEVHTAAELWTFRNVIMCLQ